MVVFMQTAAFNLRTVAQHFESQHTVHVAQCQVTHLHKVKIHILPALINHNQKTELKYKIRDVFLKCRRLPINYPSSRNYD